MNKNALESKIVLNGDRNQDLARAIGISPQRFSAKINEVNGAEFTNGEMKAIGIRYNLTPQELYEIFF